MAMPFTENVRGEPCPYIAKPSELFIWMRPRAILPRSDLTEVSHGGEQFGRRDRRSPKFPYNDACSEIGKHGGIAQGRSCSNGEREHGEHRVTRTCNVKYLAPMRGVVNACLAHTRVSDLAAGRGHMKTGWHGFFKYVQPFSTARDHDSRTSKTCQQSAP